MSGIEGALKRRREAGGLPDDVAGAAEWLPLHEGTPPATTRLLERFSNEDGPTPVRRGGETTFPSEYPAPVPRVTETRNIQPVEDRRSVPIEESRVDERKSDAPVVAETFNGRRAARSEPAAESAPAATALAETSVAEPADTPRSIAVFSGFNPSTTGKLVSRPEIDPGTAEQYRRLAVALHHVQTERGIKKVMVTSAMAGEGKTLTALNLALTLSESYRRRVVFIDADLRCSRVHELLNVVNVTGLGDVLTGASRMKGCLLEISPRLSVLLAGRHDSDPMGALTSQRMAQTLDEAAAAFDWVVVDTPPVVMLPDTNLLARMVDVAIVVVKAGKTAYDTVDRAVQAVDRKRILGVVLNDVQDAEALQYYYSAAKSALE